MSEISIQTNYFGGYLRVSLPGNMEEEGGEGHHVLRGAEGAAYPAPLLNPRDRLNVHLKPEARVDDE